MKPIVILLIGIALTPRVGLADEPKAAAVEKKAEEKKAEEKKAPKKPAAKAQKVIKAVGAALGGEADVVVVDADPLEQQFAPQFRQLLKTELHFVRTVCQPTPEQYQPIKAAGDVSLKLTLKKFADVQKKLQRGIRAGQQPEFPDPRKLIADALAQSVKQTLSAEQAQRYEMELEKRTAARKRVALINLVAKLDKDLVLTAEQRSTLTDTLNSNWKDAWGQRLEVFLYGEQYLPILPDAQVLPILNEKQKEVWKEIPKNQNMIWGWAGFGFGFGFVQAMEIEEEVPANAGKAEDREEKNGDSP